jgi:dolichyl-phosphate beta-glucosyltransferase
MSTSVILPVFNGEAFIEKYVCEITDYLRSHLRDAEVLVVNDGSTDRTHEILSSLKVPQFRYLYAEVNRGKFGALKLGMQATSSEVRMFIDADLPFDLSIIPYAAKLIQGGCHVVMGDRTLAESEILVPRSLARKIASWGFATMTRQLLAGGVFDTQCGFKAFHGAAAGELFRLVSTDSFSGDVELIYLALKYNLATRRIPVRFVRDNPSSIRVIRDSLTMLQQAITVPSRWYLGGYRSELLQSLGTQRYWESP